MRLGEAGRFVSSFYQRWNADAFAGLLEYFDLEPRSRVRHLSRGQRAQLALSLVLAQEPELLVMDDPTLGLDPVVRREFVESIVELIQTGERTVLLSSHQLSDVERVADRIAVIDRGVLRADCTLDTFRARVKRIHLAFGGTPPELGDVPGLLRTVVGDREVSLTVANYDPSLAEQLKELRPAPVEIDVEDMGLEDAFVEYTSPPGKLALQRRFEDTIATVSYQVVRPE
jgi:ABC-2 type transport system ATP-binding protein